MGVNGDILRKLSYHIYDIMHEIWHNYDDVMRNNVTITVTNTPIPLIWSC